MRRLCVLLLIGASLAGCATRGENYVPLVDMRYKSQVGFERDLADCQAYARQRPDATTGAVAGAIAGALLGAALAPHGYRNDLSAHGAALGMGAGAGAAIEKQEVVIKRCLAGRGYNVLD